MAKVATVLVVCTGDAHAGIVEDTHFDVHRSVIAESRVFDVTISTATAGASISYSVDGSDPAAQGSRSCTALAPVVVRVDVDAEEIDCGDATKVTRIQTPGFIVRAYAHKSGEEPSNTDTQSYIFLDRVVTQRETYPGWPTYDYTGNGGPAHHDYGMDPKIVDDPSYHDDLITGLLELPTMSLAAASDPFWNQVYRGEGEISASVEIMYPDGLGEQADAGLQRHSHDRTKNSLRLSFRDEFGSSKLTTELFRRARLHGAGAVGKVDRVVLRGGNNRSWARSWNPDRTTYTTDQWFRDTQLELSGVGARGHFVHLYVDGLYWGLYNPTERPDEWFTSGNQGGQSEHWFAISHGGPKDGDPSRYNYLFDKLIVRDMTELANFDELETYLDLDGFFDYLLLHWYAGVMDWPQNNWWAGVRNTPPGPVQYFAWDGEWSFATKTEGSPERPEVHSAFRADKGKGSGQATAKLFNSIKESPEVMLRLADRAYRALRHDGALSDAVARERWATLNEVVYHAVVAESARWGDAVTRSGDPTRTRDIDWQREAEFTDGYMKGGAEALMDHLRGQSYYPDLEPARVSYAGQELETMRLVVPSLPVMLSLEGAGEIYLTLDGSDPRATGGDIVGDALDDSGEITLEVASTLITRSLMGETWSARRHVEIVYCPGGKCDCDEPLVDCAGMCVDVESELDHCGGCDMRCKLSHADEVCTQGSCRIAACEPGFEDADGQPGNGCERPIDDNDEGGDGDDETEVGSADGDDGDSDAGDSEGDEGDPDSSDQQDPDGGVAESGCQLASPGSRLTSGWRLWMMVGPRIDSARASSHE